MIFCPLLIVIELLMASCVKPPARKHDFFRGILFARQHKTADEKRHPVPWTFFSILSLSKG